MHNNDNMVRVRSLLLVLVLLFVGPLPCWSQLEASPVPITVKTTNGDVEGESVMPPIIYFTHSLIHSFTHSLHSFIPFVHSFHSFTHLIHSFTHSPIHPFIHSSIHPFSFSLLTHYVLGLRYDAEGYTMFKGIPYAAPPLGTSILPSYSLRYSFLFCSSFYYCYKPHDY